MVQDDESVGLEGLRVNSTAALDATARAPAYHRACRPHAAPPAARDPGRLTRHARGWTLQLPVRWPWHGDDINALNRIRALPAA
jgi:hypothetical protein